MNPESIQFFTEDIVYRIRQKTKLRRDLEKIIAGENFHHGPVNMILCSDRFLKKYNKRFLNHNYLTDVITFDFSDELNTLSGDIFISLDRVRENAKTYKVGLREELFRVMIHGILHLMRMDDRTDEERNAMRIKEDYYLNIFVK